MSPALPAMITAAMAIITGRVFDHGSVPAEKMRKEEGGDFLDELPTTLCGGRAGQGMFFGDGHTNFPGVLGGDEEGLSLL